MADHRLRSWDASAGETAMASEPFARAARRYPIELELGIRPPTRQTSKFGDLLVSSGISPRLPVGAMRSLAICRFNLPLGVP